MGGDHEVLFKTDIPGIVNNCFLQKFLTSQRLLHLVYISEDSKLLWWDNAHRSRVLNYHMLCESMMAKAFSFIVVQVKTDLVFFLSFHHDAVWPTHVYNMPRCRHVSVFVMAKVFLSYALWKTNNFSDSDVRYMIFTKFQTCLVH